MSTMWPHEGDLADFWIKDGEQLGSDFLNRAPKEIYERLIKQSQTGFVASCIVPANQADRTPLQPTVVDMLSPDNDKVTTKTLATLDIIVVGSKIFFGSEILSYEITWSSGEVPPTDIDWYVYYDTNGVLKKILVSDDTGYPDPNKLYIARVTMNAGEIKHCLDMRGFRFHQHDSQRVRFTPDSIRCYGVFTGKEYLGDDTYWMSMSGARWVSGEFNNQKVFIIKGSYPGTVFSILETRPYIAGVQDTAIRILAVDDAPNIGDEFVIVDGRIMGDTVYDAILHHGHQGNNDGEQIQTAGIANLAVTEPKLANGAVTDAKIGNRTIDQALAGGALTGTLTQLLSWLATAVKNIKGTTNFWDAAVASIATIWDKFNATLGHKHTGAANDAPQINGSTGIEDGTITEAKLAFDVATQAELNTHKTLNPIDHPSNSVRTTHILNGNVTVEKLDNYDGLSGGKIFVPQVLADNAHVVTDTISVYPYGESRFIINEAVVHGFPYTWGVVVTVRQGDGAVGSARANYQICWPWFGPDPLMNRSVPMIRYQRNDSLDWGPWTEYHEGAGTVRPSKFSQHEINLVDNGSFEDADAIFLDPNGNPQPDGWEVGFYPGGNGQRVQSPPSVLGSVRDGQWCYRLQKNTTNANEGGGYLQSRLIPVAPGDTLLVSLWMKCDWSVGLTRNVVLFEQYQGDKSTVINRISVLDEEINVGYDWKLVCGRMSITNSDTRFVRLYLIGGYYEVGVYGNPGRADTYFDGVLLKKKTDEFRSSTLVVAAYNSPDRSKQAADYVCDGTNDEEEIFSALFSANGGEVALMEGDYNIQNDMGLFSVSNCILRGAGFGTKIYGNGKYITFLDKCIIKNCSFYNLELRIGSNILIDGCYFENDSSVSTWHSVPYSYYNVRLVNNHFNACSHAVEFFETSQVIVANNIFIDCLNAIRLLTVFPIDDMRYINITGNLILCPASGGNKGIYVSSLTSSPDRVHISGNDIAGYIDGIYISMPSSGAAKAQIVANLLEGNTTPINVSGGVFYYGHVPPTTAHTIP